MRFSMIPISRAVGFVGSTPIAHYVYSRATAHGKRAACFGGAKNHMIVMPDADMDKAVDALIGAGYGSAGERCMAISVAVPVGEATADALVEKLIPRVEKLKVGLSTDREADYGPLVTKQHLDKVKGYIDLGIKEGATLKVDGRGFKMQGYENGFFLGGSLFDNVTKDMRIYKEEIFGPVLSVVRAKTYDEGLDLANDHEYGNGVAIYTRDGDAARDFAVARPGRHGRHQCADPGAARLSHLRRLEALGLRRSQPARARCGALLYAHQDGDVALAVRHQGRRAVLHPDDAVRGVTGPNPVADAFATATVLAWRLPMLWAMAFNPTPRRRAEALKMITEKQIAVAEGMNAAALEGFSQWMKAVSGQSISAEAAGKRIMRAASRPSEKRVRAECAGDSRSGRGFEPLTEAHRRCDLGRELTNPATTRQPYACLGRSFDTGAKPIYAFAEPRIGARDQGDIHGENPRTAGRRILVERGCAHQGFRPFLHGRLRHRHHEL